MKNAARRMSAVAVISIAMIAVTALFAILLVAPFVGWQISSHKELGVWTIDKTVPYPDYREHLGFFWILKNMKISKPGSRLLYDEKSDYFGFYPYGKEDWRTVSMPENGRKPEIIYIVDTYGVYTDDYMQRRISGEISPILFGALTDSDLRIITANLGGGNTLIAEFNTAASPTNLKNRKSLGALLGMNWKGWIGKYFEDLSKGGEVPSWIVLNYEEQRRTKWNFFGRGYILISENDWVEVLTEAEDVGPDGLKFQYEEAWAKAFKQPGPISYRYWFEWTIPDPGIEVAANYRFDLSPSGAAKLKAHGLPEVFPAVLKYENPQYTGWYFAGDFAELEFAKTPFRVLGISWLKRLLVDDTVDSNVYFFWKAYVPLMRHIISGSLAKKESKTLQKAVTEDLKINVRAFGKGFQKRDKDGIWRDFFVRGVNMGLAEPGKFFTEFPQSVNTYLRWLKGISDMNANTVRIYTLPPPEFYKALYVHNTENPDKALYLLQEIWPEEHPPNGDYLALEYRESFLKEIDYGIDAVYGRANVPERRFRAWGIYTADVSPWLLGWLVGRELESEEVLATDARNKGATYKGKFVSAADGASPTEVWLAESLDEVAYIEAERYGALHPVAIVSWPTLDPLDHDSEWDPVTGKKNRWNDRAEVAIANFEITSRMTAGLFGAYHIYPNYPDLINNELGYDAYKDEHGMLRYGGYLREFMGTHGKFPALVAEFGMANGAGIAHFAPDGLHHGGIDEKTAGFQILRMMEAIKREGYMGGVVFEWMDEWAKKTWTTENLMIPYDRHVLWHNVVDPEQNYGLLANEVVTPQAPDVTYQGKDLIESLSLVADGSYLNVNIVLSREIDFSREEILIGLDTLGRDLGQMRWPVGNLSTGSGLEFVVRIPSLDKADLLVIPTYNTANSKFSTVKRWDGIFERINLLVNAKVITKDGRTIPEIYFDASALRKGAFDESGNLWRIDGNRIFLRLPWTLINVTDPSSLKVLQDGRTGYFNPQRDALKVVPTDGFVVSALAWDRNAKKPSGSMQANPLRPYLWNGWEEVPRYIERYKKSYYMLQEAWAKP